MIPYRKEKRCKGSRADLRSTPEELPPICHFPSSLLYLSALSVKADMFMSERFSPVPTGKDLQNSISLMAVDPAEADLDPLKNLEDRIFIIAAPLLSLLLTISRHSRNSESISVVTLNLLLIKGEVFLECW